jgi:hypothetical protein
MSGGLLLQWMLGYNFSVAVWVGYIALFGIAVETGVVMVVYLHEALQHRLAQETPLTEENIEQALEPKNRKECRHQKRTQNQPKILRKIGPACRPRSALPTPLADRAEARGAAGWSRTRSAGRETQNLAAAAAALGDLFLCKAGFWCDRAIAQALWAGLLRDKKCDGLIENPQAVPGFNTESIGDCIRELPVS